MISIYFATNREPDDHDRPTAFGSVFNSRGLGELRFGRADLVRLKGDRFRIERIEPFPEKLVAKSPESQRLGSKAAFEDLRRSMTGEARDTVFSIHGFNYTFEDAIRRTAQLSLWFRECNLNWLLFTWPSDGRMEPFKAYVNDRKDAEASGLAVARGMLKAADFVRALPPEARCSRRIHLMAHSMGNYVLRHAVQSMRTFVGDALPRLFDQIVLLAPDEDNDALELDHKLALLERLGRRVTLYYNMQDVALWISDLTKANPNRLGDTGPRNIAALPSTFVCVNASAAVAMDAEVDSTRHQYYRLTPAVRDDIAAVLKNADEFPNRTWRPEGSYWRLDGDSPKRDQKRRRQTGRQR